MVGDVKKIKKKPRERNKVITLLVTDDASLASISASLSMMSRI
jgi:hypothetical protein